MAAFCFFDNALDAAVAPTTLFAAACSANRDLQSEAVGFAASAAESLLEDSSRLLGAHTAVAASYAEANLEDGTSANFESFSNRLSTIGFC